MSAQPEALRLAAALMTLFPSREDGERAAAELHRLAKVEDEWAALSQDQGKLEGQIDRLVAQRDALLEALKEITPSMPPVDAPCHYGIVPQEKCGHCGRIAKARAAVKAVEEKA